jgi:hypothetical protein
MTFPVSLDTPDRARSGLCSDTVGCTLRDDSLSEELMSCEIRVQLEGEADESFLSQLSLLRRACSACDRFSEGLQPRRRLNHPRKELGYSSVYQGNYLRLFRLLNDA